MTRRLHRCLTCEPITNGGKFSQALKRGFTRHKNQICSPCRHRGVTNRGGEVRLPIDVRIPSGWPWGRGA